MLKWLSVALAVAGMAVAAWTMKLARTTPPSPPPQRPPAINPYPRGIAAAGVVEAASRNIRIAPAEPGLVKCVAVNVNDRVKAGDALMELDGRALAAELERAKAAVEVSAANVARLEAMPRKEDLEPLRAVVQRTAAQLASAENDLESIGKMHREQAATDLEMRKSTLAVEETKARLAEAQAELKRLEAGAWKADLDVSRSSMRQAAAEVRSIEMRLERLTVRSPADGVVLKRFVEPGEYCTPGGDGALVIGDLSELHVRAQIDERDAPLLRNGAPAVAVLIENRLVRYPLTMIRIEPMAMPKRQLTGGETELVDTRVIEAIYKVEPPENGEMRLYPGQVIDVFVDTGERGGQEP